MSAMLLRPPTFASRAREVHKGDHGHVLVVGGSRGFSGAARLAASASLLAGAGLVTVAVPEGVRAEVAAGDPTLMTVGLPQTTTGTPAWTAARRVLDRLGPRHVVVLGPGIGRHPDTLDLARRLVREVPVPMVVDADALHAFGSPAQAITGSAAPRVFTPHPGEAAHLLGVTIPEVQARREEAVRALQGVTGGVVVLKGAGTLVFDGAALRKNPTGNPSLAVGGSGDILSGLIGGFLAQGLAPGEAAGSATYLHGLAADKMSLEVGQRSMTPAMLLQMIPRVIALHEGRR